MQIHFRLCSCADTRSSVWGIRISKEEHSASPVFRGHGERNRAIRHQIEFEERPGRIQGDYHDSLNEKMQAYNFQYLYLNFSWTFVFLCTLTLNNKTTKRHMNCMIILCNIFFQYSISGNLSLSWKKLLVIIYSIWRNACHIF